MHWKTLPALAALSLTVAFAADDSSGAGTIAPANVDGSSSSSSAGSSAATVTSWTCPRQKNLDIDGNDLSSASGAVGDCCGICQKTSGCKAFSWSSWNGGTCWLKTSYTPTKYASGVYAAELTASNGTSSGSGSSAGSSASSSAGSSSSSSSSVCSAQKDTDIDGQDLTNMLGDLGECCGLCQKTSGCKAYSWSSYNGGTCWLKKRYGTVISASGVYSAELPASNSSSSSNSTKSEPKNVTVVTVSNDTADWTIESDVEYTGNELTTVASASADACLPVCASYINCRAFTWNSTDGGLCSLKARRGATTTKTGSVSAAFKYKTSVSGQCSAEQDTAYVGTDLGNVSATDASFCCTLCSVKKGCEAYTWTSTDGGLCLFQSNVSGSTSSSGAVAGKVVAGTSSPHIAYKLRSGEIPSRGVNLGGWLVTEWWMAATSPVWQGVKSADGWNGEYYNMQRLGKDKGTELYEQHRAAWIVEDDIAEIGAAGINIVRVPVGFWIVDDIEGVEATNVSSVFARGSLKYLDKLINVWAVKANVGVYLSLHAHQGSQNGADHSAAQDIGKANWSKYQRNVDNSIRFATLLAQRYKHAPAFVGLQLMNEPDKDTYEDVVKSYYNTTYAAIRGDGNDCVIGISPMLQKQSQKTFRDFMVTPDYTNVWVEWHVYYKWGYESSTEDEIIDAISHYRDEHFTDWPGDPILIGEWSLGNGANEEKFKDLDKMNQFAETQLTSYSEAKAGWAFWAWHHDDEYLKEDDGTNTISGWSLRQLLRRGVFKIPSY